MKAISFLIKPASSLCDMKCKYCFYDDVSSSRDVKSYGVMKYEIMQQLIKRAFLVKDVEHIHFAFQGGEPIVAGIDFFRTFIDEVEKTRKNQKVEYSIQTNGFSMNEEWACFFKEHDFLVGISLDGYGEMHNSFRRTSSKGYTHTKIMKSIDMLKKNKVDFNILSVLTAQMARQPKKLYSFYKKEKFKYIQLIPCLPELGESKSEYSLTPKMFAQFYKSFFDLWLKDYKKGNYMSITLFDNLIPMFAGYPPQQCGMLGQCMPQFVVESNGDIYPCDFYVLDQYRCGNVLRDSIEDIISSKAMKEFLLEPRRQCLECDTCQFINICHRNCKRLNVAYYTHQYCGYKDFLEYAAQEMYKIALTL